MVDRKAVVVNEGLHAEIAPGDVLVDGSGNPIEGTPTNQESHEFTLDGLGVDITLGAKGDIRLPYTCRLLSVTLTAPEGPGSI